MKIFALKVKVKVRVSRKAVISVRNTSKRVLVTNALLFEVAQRKQRESVSLKNNKYILI